LKLLGEEYNNICKDPRTLRKTPRTTDTKAMDGGFYVHFGLIKNILLLLMDPRYKDTMSIGLQLNFDGVEVKDNNMWPQQARIVSPFLSSPFLVGTFYGPKKLTDVHEYLKDLIVELKISMENGIHHPITDKCVKVWLHSVCCDIPAKALIKQMPGHTGFSSCDKCYVLGETLAGRRAFVEDNVPLRDNDWFTLHRTNSSPFQVLQVDMSTLFPIDYMHCVCLGIMKTLIWIWYDSEIAKPKYKRDLLDRAISELQSKTPCDFNTRTCDPLSVGDQKATQYRLFLLYVGPVVLKNFLSEDEYRNFLKLNVAITIMCHPAKHRNLVTFAHQLLKSFVQQFSVLYGAHLVSSNFHYLYHIGEDCKRYGPLDLFSCFPYEANMGKIKGAINSPSYPASQLFRRFHEKLTLAYETAADAVLDDTNTGPMNKPTNCDYFWRGDCCISNVPPNNAVLLDGKPAFVRSFTDRKVMINSFIHVEPFYTRPLPSSDLDVVLARIPSDVFWHANISRITCKCFAFDVGEGFVFLPIIHTVN